MYLWFKFLHVFFVISWFAGLFYLPRIYVNWAQVDAAAQPEEYARLEGMALRLYRFMTPLGIGALAFGLAIPFATGWWNMGWVHVKTLCGVVLAVYHLYCRVLLTAFVERRNVRSHKWYRVFNEIPVLLMIAALVMVVFKPF
ncbi:CopD family protein [Neisseria sp.]|uniref:CopD family protein n=1 Tax=Neisseria sp. TaxID=192066 RepID=UPI0035A04AFE